MELLLTGEPATSEALASAGCSITVMIRSLTTILSRGTWRPCPTLQSSDHG